jgi:membrane associated rhomboid family serine protease
MANNSFLDQLKNQYKNGGMHIRLVAWNLAVFLLISLLMAILGDNHPLLGGVFTMPSNFYGFATHPWSVFTSIFSHFGFMHFLFNMIFLYFAGQMFLQFFSGKRLLYTYIFGGIFGGLVHLGLSYALPMYINHYNPVVGASGAIMAIFIALAVYKPKLSVYLYGILKVPMFALALFFVLKDFLSIGESDNIAHFVHLGGALFGFWSVRKLNTSNNIITRLAKVVDSIKIKITDRFANSKLRKVQGRKPASKLKDDEYNVTKKMSQEQIDTILDKISRSGYDSLTKLEKEFLFKQSSK